MAKRHYQLNKRKANTLSMGKKARLIDLLIENQLEAAIIILLEEQNLFSEKTLNIIEKLSQELRQLRQAETRGIVLSSLSNEKNRHIKSSLQLIIKIHAEDVGTIGRTLCRLRLFFR